MSNIICSCVLCKREFTRNSSLFTHSCYANHHKKSGIKGGAKTKSLAFTTQVSKWKFYYLHPNVCACGKEKDWFHKDNKYCSASCGASHSNKNRKTSGYKESPETKLKRSISASRVNREVAERRPKFSKVSFCVICGNSIPYKHLKSCSKQCYSEILSNTAKSNPMMGGNKNNRAHGWYDSKFAGKVWLESSYEQRVALELDSNNIKWIRPSYIPYTVNGKNKKYFPDFYLTDYNVYLDPKNDYLIQIDSVKIDIVEKQNNVKILILNKNQLSWDSILTELETGFEPVRG